MIIRTRREIWENREQILANVNELLKRAKNKKGKFLEQTRKKLVEGDLGRKSKTGMRVSPDQVKKIQWVLVNKLIPMLRRVGELQRDLDFLDSAKFGEWDIPKIEVRERSCPLKNVQTIPTESKRRRPVVIRERETSDVTRVDRFKDEWDDKKTEVTYPSGPLGRYRGISDHNDQYIWNQLGTEEAKKELLQILPKKLRSVGGGIWSSSFRLVELEKEGRTIVYHRWSWDSSD
jgi:hypothetical protein